MLTALAPLMLFSCPGYHISAKRAPAISQNHPYPEARGQPQAKGDAHAELTAG